MKTQLALPTTLEIPRSISQSMLGEGIAPAYRPSDFGMPNVSWAWKELGNREYYRRAVKLADLGERAREVPAFKSDQFSLDQLSMTFGCLRRSFGEAGTVSGGWEQLQSHESSSPRRLIKMGLLELHDRPGSSRMLIDESELLGVPLDRLRVNVERYKEIDEREHLYLNQPVALLLVPERSVPNSLVVTLKPFDSTVEVDERFFNFFELCAEQQIPFRWDRTIESLFLGNYDLTARATNSAKLYIFPQYSPTKVEEGRNLQDLGLGREAETGEVKVEGATDTEATLKYREAAKMLDDAEKETYFYFSLKKLGELLSPIDQHLTNQQRDLISAGITQYICRSLLTSNLKNIEGLNCVPRSFQNKLEIPPPVARDLKRVYSEISSEDAIKIAACLDSQGRLLAKVYDLPRPDGVLYNSHDWPAIRTDVHERFYYTLEAPTDPLVQSELNRRFTTYLASILSPSLAKDDLVDIAREIRYYAEIRSTMSGTSKSFNFSDHHPLSLELCFGICLLLERAIGEKLPGLRQSITYLHRKKASDIFDLIDGGAATSLPFGDAMRERLKLN